MITYQYRVNMTPGGIAPRCKLNQYDDDWTIVFSLYSDAGEFTIQSGTTAKIRGTKKDGLGYSANATIDISNQKVTVTGDKQITAVAGENTFELVLYKGEKELSTANIIFYVEPAAMDSGTLVSDSQVQEILDMSADVIAASANVSTLRGNFAPTYSTGPYAVGDYVMHDNQLYRCTTATTTGEAWTAGHWTAVALGDDVSDLKSDCYQHRGSLTSDANPQTANVLIGTYGGRKTAETDGYPDDMAVGHYCIITYYAFGTNVRYFTVRDVSTGTAWFWGGQNYTMQATESEVQELTVNAITIPESGNVKAPDVLKDNYIPNGTAIEFASTGYKSISRLTGEVTSLDDTVANNAHWRVSDPISAHSGQQFILSLVMRYNNGIIAFFDESGNMLKTVPASVGTVSGSNYFVSDYLTTAPNETSYFLVGYYDTAAMQLVLVDSFAIKAKSLLGKKWAFIGDSLSDPLPTRASKKYYDYIAERTGITTVNLGKSGTGYANDYNGAGRFITRVPSIPDDTDVVTIFGSGNDMNVLPIGTAEDTTESTVMGYVYLTIQAIFEQKPKVLLGIIAPTPWIQYPPYTDGNKMLTFVTELEKMCKKYSVPFLDLYRESNMRPWEETFRQNFYSKDGGNGVHPDEEGNKRFAPLVQDFLERIVLSKS